MAIQSALRIATIANGASLSGAINLGSLGLFAIQMPSTWTAANLTFQASYDNSTFADVYDDTGTELSVTAATSRFIILAVPMKFHSLQRIKIRSGTTGSAVTQGGARTLQLICMTY